MQEIFKCSVLCIASALGTEGFRGAEIDRQELAGNRDHAITVLDRPAALAYHGESRALAERRAINQRGGMVSTGSPPSADDSPLTRASLLVQLRDGSNTTAWHEFVTLYGSMVYGFARKRGLQDADAADLMQDVLRSVNQAIGRLDYDRKRGTFRGWLFTITRNKVFNFLSARRLRPQGSGDTAANKLLETQPGDSDGGEEWELEYQRRLAGVAMEQVKLEFQEKTWHAFWLTAVEGRSAADASHETGLSAGAVYVAKSRVLARLKEAIDELRRQEES
ncbi:MAG: sigma-70 family RNA polymerase sigma factor [Planctomycetaceae bacterium]